MSLFNLPAASRTLEGLVEGIDCLEPVLIETGGIPMAPIDIDVAARLLGSAVRIFVAAGNASAVDNDDPLPSFEITPTDAVVAAAALLRDQNLTPFELTIWFQRVGSELKKSNSFNEAKDRAKVAFSERLANAEGELA